MPYLTNCTGDLVFLDMSYLTNCTRYMVDMSNYELFTYYATNARRLFNAYTVGIFLWSVWSILQFFFFSQIRSYFSLKIWVHFLLAIQGILWFDCCGTSNIRKPSSAIIEIEKEGKMEYGIRAFETTRMSDVFSTAKP